MVKILSVRAIGDGNYKFTCYNEEKKYKFNFKVSPESCCPPFFTPEDLRITTRASKSPFGSLVKNNVSVSDCKNIITDKIINWMNNTQYDPHKLEG